MKWLISIILVVMICGCDVKEEAESVETVWAKITIKTQVPESVEGDYHKTLAYLGNEDNYLGQSASIDYEDETEDIGEVYVTTMYWDNYIREEYSSNYWKTFTNIDLDDKIGDWIKIDGMWHKEDRVLVYSDIPDRFEKKRQEIKERVEKEAEEEK